MMCKMTGVGTVLCLTVLFPQQMAASEKEQEESFVVIEEVYPFSDPEKLLDTMGTLLENHMPVVLGIMPIYEHTDYPSMLEFGEVIRYGQSQDCRILLHFPIVQKRDVQAEEIVELLESQMEMYEAMDIYPQGILCGQRDQDYRWMEEELERLLPVFWVAKDDLEYYDQRLKESYPILKTRQLPRIFYVYHPEKISEDFDFQRDLADHVTVSLEGQNKVLMIIVVIGISVFTGMIWFARRRNRKDFFKGEEEEK